jgi:hypothetical protein
MTMDRRDDGTHVTEVEASGGTKGHGVRYVLAGGLVLAVVAMSAVWIIPALSG